MTPEQYHLTEGPKVRQQLIDQVAEQDKAYKGALIDAVKARATRAGFRIPRVATCHNDYRCVHFRTDSISLNISTSKADEEVAAAYIRLHFPAAESTKQKRATLCKHLTTAGARQFGSFVRTKYGKVTDQATLKKAHAEWLDLISCSC